MQSAFPEGFAAEMEALLGEESARLLAALGRRPVRGLRLNGLKPSERLWAQCQGLRAVPWCAEGRLAPEDLRPGRSPRHAAGLYYMQEPSAMAPAGALEVLPGERVLDLCAAPGGKSTQLAAAMGGRGVLVANEIHPGRARVLLENLERLGVENAVVLCEKPERLLQHFGAWFDAVLVDAPCSGEGLFRREEEARRQWSPAQVEACAQRQAQILRCAAGLVRPGGRLVYSTCTFNKKENEGNVEGFLREQPGFCLEGEPRRLLPHRVEGEGQFFARFRRRQEGRGTSLQPLRHDGAERSYWEFSQRFLSLPWQGPLLRQGEWLYGVGEDMPDLRGLRVLRAGLQLGRFRPGRFEPAHALALRARPNAFRQAVELDGERAAAYLRGLALELEGPLQGWTVACVDGWPLGWGKADNGVLKNHYPKGLRMLGS